MRQSTEAQTADAELPDVSSRTSAQLAPVVLARSELWCLRVLHSFCSGCHSSPLTLCRLAEGHAEGAQQRTGFVVVFRRCHDGDVHALLPLHLRVIDLRED